MAGFYPDIVSLASPAMELAVLPIVKVASMNNLPSIGHLAMFHPDLMRKTVEKHSETVGRRMEYAITNIQATNQPIIGVFLYLRNLPIFGCTAQGRQINMNIMEGTIVYYRACTRPGGDAPTYRQL